MSCCSQWPCTNSYLGAWAQPLRSNGCRFLILAAVAGLVVSNSVSHGLGGLLRCRSRDEGVAYGHPSSNASSEGVEPCKRGGRTAIHGRRRSIPSRLRAPSRTSKVGLLNSNMPLAAWRCLSPLKWALTPLTCVKRRWVGNPLQNELCKMEKRELHGTLSRTNLRDILGLPLPSQLRLRNCDNLKRYMSQEVSRSTRHSRFSRSLNGCSFLFLRHGAV